MGKREKKDEGEKKGSAIQLLEHPPSAPECL